MPYKIPDEFLAELNQRVDIGDLISNYVNLRQRGNRMVGLCPFHNEKTGSFTVFSDTNSYYCFGCGAGGGPITFVRQIENLDFSEAVKMLADRCGMQLPETGYDNTFAKLKKRILEINRETARFYHKHLLSPAGKPVLDYFLSRKLKPETIKHFGLGAAPDGWDNLLRHLRSKGYREDEMLQANVIMRGQRGGYYDRFRNRAMFPIIDLRGNVIAFGGRALPGEDKKGAKYINTSDTPVFKKSQNLYALNFAKNNCSKGIILAEGYMDVIALHQAGITNAVAALGTAFTDEHALLLSRYTSEITLCLDADAAGQKATERALGILSKSGLPTKVLRIPDGKDPDEFIKNNGDTADTAFRDLVSSAMNSTEYKLIEAAKGIDVSTDGGRLEYLKKCTAVLSTLNDDIAVDLYAGQLAQRFSIGKQAILTEVKNKSRKLRRNQNKQKFKELIQPKFSTSDVNPERHKHLRASKAEEEIISILIYNPDLMNIADEHINEDSFVTTFNSRVYGRVAEVIHNGLTFDVTMLGEDFSAAESGRVAEYQNRIAKSDNAKDTLLDSIKVLKQEKDSAVSNVDELSVDEWASRIKKIAESKKSNK